MGINTDRCVILALIAMGALRRQRPNGCGSVGRSRETAWILAISLVIVCLAQLKVHSLVPMLMHFLVPALAEAARKALSPITGPITDLMPLTRMGGLL